MVPILGEPLYSQSIVAYQQDHNHTPPVYAEDETERASGNFDTFHQRTAMSPYPLVQLSFYIFWTYLRDRVLSIDLRAVLLKDQWFFVAALVVSLYRKDRQVFHLLPLQKTSQASP